MSKRTLIASTVMGAFALTGSAVVSATTLSDLHSEEAKIHAAAAKSQEKINSLFEQSQELLVEYRGVVDETENLKIYNDYLASLVADQQRGIDSLQKQIDSIEDTKKGIVPLMFHFIVAKVVSSMTAEPPAEIQQIVEDIRIPRGAGAASSH